MESVIFEIKDNVATLKLNRPAKFNSFNKEMALRFQDLLDHCDANDEVRAIYITAEGKAFCAGQDLQEVTDPNGPELSEIVSKHYNPIIERIRTIEKPIVMAVNGVAAGAGANIALAGDICVAAESANFIQAFSKIGLIPDSAGTFFLPRLIGLQKASALMMLGDKISASEAENLGMMYKVFSDQEFAEKSYAISTKLASMPTKGLGLTKRALNQSFTNNLTQQLDLEDQLQNAAGKTLDYKEGVSAFMEKRKPKFTGK